jgi:hypothetical protein
MSEAKVPSHKDPWTNQFPRQSRKKPLTSCIYAKSTSRPFYKDAKDSKNAVQVPDEVYMTLISVQTGLNDLLQNC